jgi:phosphoribosylanthranilate isomerase
MVSKMRVKICGVTRLEDAEAAIEAGAWAIGVNHWPQGVRTSSPEVAVEIGAAVKRRCELAGVFVNAPLDEIARAAIDEQLTLVQLHGDEGPAFCAEVARRTGCRVMKAIHVRSGADLRAAEAYRTDFHLLDTHRLSTPGGTGESFDWELVSERRSDVPMILAGGLTADNVAAAIQIARPWGVDVASGVEVAPGIKNPARIKAFVEAAERASRATEPAGGTVAA